MQAHQPQTCGHAPYMRAYMQTQTLKYIQTSTHTYVLVVAHLLHASRHASTPIKTLVRV